MHLPGARAGLAIAAFAQLAYLPAAPQPLPVAMSIVTFAGLALAAAARGRGRTLLAGFALAAAPAVYYVAESLRGGFALSLLPNAAATVGLLMCTVAARGAGHDFGVRAGLATSAFASALWLLLDPFNVVSLWLPGNLLSILGFGLAAATFRSEAPYGAPAEAPT